MMSDLFEVNKLEKIPLEDASVFFLRKFELGQQPDQILHELIRVTPWRHEAVTVWGKTYKQPRLIAWYGDEGRGYSYSGIKLLPLGWTPLLSDLKRRCELLSQTEFNSVLLNYYRDGTDSMGFHSDDEPELGRNPVIASVSLGEQRLLVFKHKKKLNLKPVRLKLTSGSLLIMRDDTQDNWKHGIPKETRACGPRINLTFRSILNN